MYRHTIRKGRHHGNFAHRRGTVRPALPLERTRRILEIAGPYATRYALVAVIVLNALLKWTNAEAAAIQPLLAHSPFYAWL